MCRSQVRTAVAYVISSIAHWDWPEKWPALFNVLITCLRDNELAIDGAMRVLTEFSRDLTEAQLPNLVPIILQEMYKIFQNENVSPTERVNTTGDFVHRSLYII